MRNPLIRAFGGSLLIMAMAGCGGSDDAVAPPAPAPVPAPAPPAPPVGIGPSGGTVTGSNGATIVVPAGALSQTVNLQITEINPASANLPAGAERVGAVYALTPHDTTFAVPVTVTVPFDPAQVPGGRSVTLQKTNDAARTVWSVAAGATASGSMVSAQVSSFSHLFPALVANASGAWASVGSPLVIGQPVRLGGMAVSAGGRVAVSYVVGSGGTAGLVGELRVSEWDGATWTQLGGALNLSASNGPSLSWRSIAYNSTGRPVVAWLDRLTLLLVVQRWNGSAWERLGDPLFAAAAATADPQIAVDPVSDRPVVVITSGPNVTIREWDGANWTPAGFVAHRASLAPAVLTIVGGQRLLGITYGANTSGSLLLTGLHAQNTMGQYVNEVGAPVSSTPYAASNFYLDMDSDGTGRYALIGDQRDGPMLVRRWNGSTWGDMGGDLGFRNFRGAQMRVTPTGLPLVAYGQGNVPLRRVDLQGWDGTAWKIVPSPNLATVDVVGFALGLAASGQAYAALAQRPAASTSTLATELQVRTFVP